MIELSAPKSIHAITEAQYIGVKHVITGGRIVLAAATSTLVLQDEPGVIKREIQNLSGSDVFWKVGGDVDATAPALDYHGILVDGATKDFSGYRAAVYVESTGGGDITHFVVKDVGYSQIGAPIA